MWIYLIIAFLILPVYVPSAVLAIEPPGRRRKVMGAFVVLGAVVSGILLVTMVGSPVSARLADYHLEYHVGSSIAGQIVPAYIVATCGSFLFSGVRNLAVFGIVNLVAVVALAVFVLEGLASLWCAWAALTSAAFAVHLRLAGPGALDVSPIAGGPHHPSSPSAGLR